MLKGHFGREFTKMILPPQLSAKVQVHVVPVSPVPLELALHGQINVHWVAFPPQTDALAHEQAVPPQVQGGGVTQLPVQPVESVQVQPLPT